MFPKPASTVQLLTMLALLLNFGCQIKINVLYCYVVKKGGVAVQDNAVIKMISTVESDGDSEKLEFVSEGKFIYGNPCRISYQTDDENGIEHTMIRAVNGEVAIYRKGSVRSQLTVKKGERYVGHYDIGVAGMAVGVSGREVSVGLNEKGGRIFLKYAIDINSQHVSENTVEIMISLL